MIRDHVDPSCSALTTPCGMVALQPNRPSIASVPASRRGPRCSTSHDGSASTKSNTARPTGAVTGCALTLALGIGCGWVELDGQPVQAAIAIDATAGTRLI